MSYLYKLCIFAIHQFVKDMANTTKPFFWLHLKKCAGNSFRKSFTPPYVQTDRVKNPKPFIAVPKEEWNDVLNNFRVPLGEYDNKRMLFAKKFLYSEDEFNNMYKFTIVRNPYDRIVSVWKYVFRKRQWQPKRILMKHSFSYFISQLPTIMQKKYDRFLVTHAAPIWPDITDENGVLLMDEILKLENLGKDIEVLNQKIGTNIKHLSRENVNRQNNSYRKYYTEKTKKKVEELYGDDIKNLKYTFSFIGTILSLLFCL